MMTPERISFAVSILLAGLLVWFGLSGKSQPRTWRPSQEDRANYEPAGVPRFSFVEDDLARYWESGASSPFVAVSDKRDLPPQDIDLPPAIVGSPAMPDFEPTPDPDFVQGAAAGTVWPLYAREPSGRTYPQASELPSLSDLETLRAAALAAMADTPKDPSIAEEPKFDSVILRSGKREEGTILDESPETVTFRRKNGGMIKFDRKDILSVSVGLTAAAEYRESSKKIATNDAKSRLDLAQQCLGKGLTAEAIEEIGKALQADPKFIKAYLALAELYRVNTDLNSELGVLERALDAGVLNAERVHERRAQVYSIVGLPAEETAALEAAVKADPTYVAARIRLGLAHIRAGRYEDAWEHLDKARGLAGQDPTVHAAIARYYFRRAELDSALQAADDALAKDGGAAAVHNLRGVILALQGKYGDAGRAFLAALKAGPFTSDAWQNLGVLFVLADKLDEGAFAFEQARKLDPAAATALAAAGMVRHLRGQVQEARPNFLSALDIEPNNYYAHYALGHSYLETGEDEAAATELTQSLKRRSSFAPALYSAGVAFLRQQSYARAVRLLKRVAAVDGNRPRAQSTLGIAWLGAQDMPRAEGALREALRLDPDHSPALCGLAYAAFQAGRGQEAISKFSRVLEVKPDDAYVSRALTLVRESATRTLWEDSFDRGDREDVGRQWFEAERHGIGIELKEKRVVFSGAQSVADLGITSLHRVVPAETFLRIEAEIDVTDVGNATVGVFIQSKSATGEGRSGVYFSRSEKNRLQYAFTAEAGDGGPRWQDLGVESEKSPFRIAIERTRSDDGSRAFAFLVNGKALQAKKSPSFMVTENYTVGVFGQALRGEKWNLVVHRVRVIEEKRTK